MYQTIAEFLSDWQQESVNTAKYLDVLTDGSLSVKESDEDRTLGRIAWHIVTTIPEMMKHTGITIETVKEDAPVPATAQEIAQAYRSAASCLVDSIKSHWTDDSLKVEDSMYGATWARSLTLQVLIRHEIHHRGQMSVLMRQAGLKVPGIYGPSREEWQAFGMNPPAV